MGLNMSINASASPSPSLFQRALGSLSWLLPPRFRAGIPVVPVVRLSGVIGAGASLVRSGMTLHQVEPALSQAFSIKAAPVVAEAWSEQV